jgi:hypothetical protein
MMKVINVMLHLESISTQSRAGKKMFLGNLNLHEEVRFVSLQARVDSCGVPHFAWISHIGAPLNANDSSRKLFAS